MFTSSATITEAINWRYATKTFDPTQKLTDQEYQTLIEATRLAPSCYGLQPWKVIEIRDLKLRSALQAAAYGQLQVVEADRLFVFAARQNLDENYVDNLLSHFVQLRGKTKEELDGLKQAMLGTISHHTDDMFSWNARQTYIALGFMLETAAFLGLDTCPMEGFDRQQFDQLLGLSESGVSAVAMVAVGHRLAAAGRKPEAKVRWPLEDLLEVK